MADVDMTDAPVTKKKGGENVEAKLKADGKKRFEVKKVIGMMFLSISGVVLILLPVECGCAMGVGHSGGQLCHLQKPHYGSL
jgi:hypothetical protein